MKELLRAWGDPHTWGFSPVPRTSSWCPYTARLVVGIDFSKAIEMADKRAFIKKNDQVRLIKHVLSSQKMTPLFRQIKPMIVKNIPFANLPKSFWNKIIPTANLQCWGQRAGSVPLGGSHWASIRKEHQRREAWGSQGVHAMESNPD